jgi:hypothetical protein
MHEPWLYDIARLRHGDRLADSERSRLARTVDDATRRRDALQHRSPRIEPPFAPRACYPARTDPGTSS